MKGAFKVAGLFKRNGKAKGGKSETLSETVFRDQFAVATVLFCVSGLGIIGSMREGLTGECSLLLIKGVLDLFTAMLISASIGSVVGVLAVPQCAIQFALLFGATMLMPYTTPTMFADFSACGGIIMLGAGARQMGLVQVPILSMLPGLFFVMPAVRIMEADYVDERIGRGGFTGSPLVAYGKSRF